MIASRELMPHLDIFPNAVSEIVRDYIQEAPPPADAATWEIARRCFRGNGEVAGIVQEYNLGVRIAYLEIAEGVRSAASNRIWAQFSTGFSSIAMGCDLGNRDQLRRVCRYIVSNVRNVFRRNMEKMNPVKQNNISRTIRFVEMARHTLTAIHALHTGNPLEEIPDQNVERVINDEVTKATKPLAERFGFSLDDLLCLPPAEREHFFLEHQRVWELRHATVMCAHGGCLVTFSPSQTCESPHPQHLSGPLPPGDPSSG